MKLKSPKIIKRTIVNTESMWLYELRKPCKSNPAYRIIENPITIITERCEWDNGNITFHNDAKERIGEVQIQPLSNNVNEIMLGRFMLADKKDKKFFVQKMNEYFEAEIKVEEEKIAKIKDRITAVNEIAID
jgi:hypothetical protein